MNNPSFFNKNQFRRYPVRASSSLLTVDGKQMPDDCITGLNITLPMEVDIQDTLYIKKVVSVNGIFSVELADDNGSAGSICLKPSTDFQSVKLTSNSGAAGWITLGTLEALSRIDGCYVFEQADALIEPSCIKYHNAPAVTALNVRGVDVVGAITFAATGVRMTTGSNTLTFNVTSPATIASRADLNSQRLTCKLPLITSINGVQPNPATGEIEIYAVAPLTISATVTGLQVSSEDITTSDLCNQGNQPQYSETSNYKGYLSNGDPEKDVLTANDPEWKDWPQY